MTSSITYTDFYSDKINHLTLRVALNMHYQLNPQFTRFDVFETQEGADAIRNHDISHIIYGQDTSMFGEYCVQMYNNFGSANTASKVSFKLLFSKDLKAMIGLVLPTSLISYVFANRKMLKKIEKEIKAKASKMTKKWNYDDVNLFMDKTLGDIRQQHNIIL
jgi:ubiquinone biosynthesis protein Coq4